MVIDRATPKTEKEGALPAPQLQIEMGKYNEELMKAGVLLTLNGLHPSSKGARVKFSGNNRTVIDGAFTEAKELIAGLTRITRDLGLAEDLAQEVLVAALEQWPRPGVPENPGAWLTAAAKRRDIDLFRRNAVAERKHEELARELETLEQTDPDLNSSLDDPIGDDLLRLVFISCHPILATGSRAALALRLFGGLTPEPTIAQRIVRAKRTLVE
jgi:predicted RNA polymerase sigma factor